MKLSKPELYKKLQEPIQAIVDIITANKTLEFPIEIYNFEESLLEAKILQITNGKYEIIDYEIISFPFLDFYKKRFSFEPTEDFKKSSEFLNGIRQDFYSKGYVANFSDLEDKLWKLFVTEANKKYSCDFNKYLKALDKEEETDEIFSFTEVYSACLQNLNIPVKIFYENLLVLLGLIESDVGYNLPLGTITGGIRQKCRNDISFGVELFNYCYAVPDINDNILASVVSGLFEAKRGFIFENYLTHIAAFDLLLVKIFVL
ncbi:MAG TPA: hypothetical protein VFW07_16875 [Parafilimonas sp.]|nr:hypothetical protein [Parafilimonas sp.]